MVSDIWGSYECLDESVSNGYVMVICVNVGEWLREYNMNEWKYARSVCERKIEGVMFEAITHKHPHTRKYCFIQCDVSIDI